MSEIMPDQRRTPTTESRPAAPVRRPAARPSPRPSAGRWRGALVVAVVLVALAVGVGVFDQGPDPAGDDLAGGDLVGAPRVERPELPARARPPDQKPTPSPVEPAPRLTPAPVLALSDDFPTSGPGRFSVVESESAVMGEAGPVVRYRVAVEDGIEIDASAFAEFVDHTLGHEYGWTAGGDLRLQRVADGHDFTIYLATSDTTDQMCATGGLAITAPGMPEGGVSCRLGGQVIINLSRWRLSVPHFVDADVPLVTYRQMVLNHEVGHELGYGHAGCPGPDEPAPVMQQQTISLGGCVANPWPYPDGEYHTGPPVD